MVERRNLYYFAPTFYPSPTGFGVAFTNIVRLISKKTHFDKIHVITLDTNAILPKDLQDKCCIYHLKLRGAEKVGSLPNVFSKLIFKYLLRDLIIYLNKHNPTEEDVFFYEEFHISFIKWVLDAEYPQCENFIRVHGTFPEFTMNYQRLKFRKKHFDWATINKKKNIVTTTNFYIDYLNENYFKNSYDVIQNINYFILPNLLEVNIENPVSVNNDTNLDEKYFKILQLGRMDEIGYFQKGFEDTIKALIYIESNMPEVSERIELTIIGSGSEVKRFFSIKNKLKKVKINFYDSLPNEKVQEILSDTDLVLMPSRCEGMSMFATEVIYKGKPIIFTANNGLRDYLIDGVNGFKVQEYDYTEIAEALIEYANNRRLLLEHGRNNLNLARQISEKTSACVDVIFDRG